jgi:hypothetical protein
MMENSKIGVELLGVESYREFLASSLNQVKTGKRPLSYAELSRRAGFSSRSYPADVIKGLRRITPATLPLFVKGLRLRGQWKNYFTLLVASEEADINTDRMTSEEIKEKLARLRARIQSFTRKPSAVTPKRFYERRGWLEVYAALGTMEKGATLKDIVSRTGYSQLMCESIVKVMVEFDVASLNEASDRYRPCAPHIIFDRLGGESFFQNHYLALLEEVQREARGPRFKKEENFFFTSVFSVNRRKAPELKSRLRELMHEFSDGSEVAEGDSIAKLCVSFMFSPE